MIYKKIGLFIACTCFASSLFAQKSSFFVRATSGYHAAVDETNFGDYQTANNNWRNSIIQTGAGIPIGIGLGYMLTNNLGIEVSNQFIAGQKVNIYTNALRDDYSETRDIKFDVMHLIPSVLISTNGKCAFYIKAGVVLPILSNTKLYSQETLTTGEVSSTTYDIKNKFIVGINGAVGLKIQIRNKLSFIAEIEEINIISKFDTGELIAKTGDPIFLDTRNNITYVENYSGSPSDNKDISNALSLRNAGINIGFLYNFNR